VPCATALASEINNALTLFCLVAYNAMIANRVPYSNLLKPTAASMILHDTNVHGIIIRRIMLIVMV